jgi:hypothetical protein
VVEFILSRSRETKRHPFAIEDLLDELMKPWYLKR